MQWELTESSPNISRGSVDVVGSSLDVCRKFVGSSLIGYRSSPGVRRKNTGSSLGVHRRKSRARWGFIGKMPGFHRRDDWTMNICQPRHKGQPPVARATAYNNGRSQEWSQVVVAPVGTMPIGRSPVSRGSARGGTAYEHGAHPRVVVVTRRQGLQSAARSAAACIGAVTAMKVGRKGYGFFLPKR
ncbi:hypothetical protein BHE74_00031251 [Ensete ventricosum]|nr:hypothetical protein BHE74_00031251 [Ensete ventricosum]